MDVLTLYPTYEEVYFLERLNRFVMLLQTRAGKTIRAHIPNTGRMEELCQHHHPFFITPLTHTKYPYKVVATEYQGNFVFLDTIKVNAIFEQLLIRNLIPQFQQSTQIKREVTFGNSKFDFTFFHDGRPTIAEVKSCTLCHNGLAMFPDAPTVRGQKHLTALEQLAKTSEYQTYVIFLVLNTSAERFMPNFHTDFEYGTKFLAAEHVHFSPFKLHFTTPVSVDLQSIQGIPIDVATLRTHCRNKGSYLLVLENPAETTTNIGKLGTIKFQKGWYVYVGSALNSLDSRLKRHQRKRKKHFWHIDYIASTIMKTKKVYPIRRSERIESQLAQAVEQLSDGAIKGFGTSDAPDGSHLFYFSSSPVNNARFITSLFDARTF